MAMWRRQPEPSEAAAEILDLRHFGSSDMRPLFEEETAVWERTLCWDYRSSVDMILRYVDAKILPGYAAVKNGTLLGYAFFVYEGNKGVVGDLFVSDPKRARLGFAPRELENILLKHVVETVQQSPGVHRVEAQLLAHEAGSVSSPFLNTGFRRHPRLFMVQRLSGPSAVALGAIEVPPDIELRRWTEADYQAAAGVITAAYANHIDSEINDQYRSVSGALRFLNNIVRFPGCGIFDPASSFVAVHRRSATAVGIILCSRVKDDVGHVTQVCLVPEQRGRRIGEALLNATAADLADRKFSLLTLTVTEANLGAVSLYKKLGYRVNRIFDAFVWEK
jgi:ribosomal protein S18 acetylase RimI-like enzyme